jgi:hypothetical protein
MLRLTKTGGHPISHTSEADILENTVPADFYRARQRRLMDDIGSGVALINSSGLGMPRLWDKNTLYLTGLFGKEVYLLLAPNGVAVDHVESMDGPELGRGYRYRGILFVPEPSPYGARFFAEGANFDDLREATGVDADAPRLGPRDPDRGRGGGDRGWLRGDAWAAQEDRRGRSFLQP